MSWYFNLRNESNLMNILTIKKRATFENIALWAQYWMNYSIPQIHSFIYFLFLINKVKCLDTFNLRNKKKLMNKLILQDYLKAKLEIDKRAPES